MSMPPRPSFSNDSQIIKNNNTFPKSMLLRDYLLDDFSSCSSNGFRSYPRRQCCTTVRFLVDSDLKRTRKHRRSIAGSKSKQSSILQKASAVMIHAFKRLPFAGTGTVSGAGGSLKARFLPRSFSRRLLKYGLWKNTDDNDRNNEIKRLKSFGDLLKENETPPPPSPSPSPSPSSSELSTAVTATATAELRSLTSNSSSWSGSDFTATSDRTFISGDSSEVNLARNDVVGGLLENEKMMINRDGVGITTVTATGATATGVTATNYSDSNQHAKKKWQDKHDEQFSPVSVMDFPSDNDNDVDEEDEVSSVFPRKHLDIKGKKVSTHKTRVFERVHQLEPVKLEDRLAQPVHESSTVTFNECSQENQVEKKAMALLQLMKSTVSSYHLLKYEAIDRLLSEFFKENMLKENVSDYETLRKAKEWMDGQEQEMFIDWECNNNREIYLRDMEKGVKWSNYDHQLEKVNVGLEVECEIFSSLVNDVLIEFNLQDLDNEDYNL